MDDREMQFIHELKKLIEKYQENSTYEKFDGLDAKAILRCWDYVYDLTTE